MISISHLSGHNFANAADAYQIRALQKLFERELGEIEWHNVPIQKKFNSSNIESLNKNSAVIIGPGGFIIPSSFFNNDETGWISGISTDLITKISSPIIVYAVGWNIFREEKFNDEVFKDNISALIKHSKFFSLRHKGDVKKCIEYTGITDKIKFNFCPSLIAEYENAKYKKRDTGKIAFQLAFDRIEKRFGSKKNFSNFIKNMNSIYKYLSDQNKEILLVSHTVGDVKYNSTIFEKIKKINKNCNLVNLANKSPDLVKDFYREIETTFTMRGHGQMIPMGIGCKVVSLISHDKIRYLLEDLNILETGVDVNDYDFFDNCIRAYEISQKTNFYSKLRIVKRNIDKNMNEIKSIIVDKYE